MQNKIPKYINAQIYSLNNLFINSGDTRLDRNILTVVGFLIKEADSYITKRESDPETKPFITFPVNTIIQLVGKRDNYIKVVKYLIENNIIEWYKSESSEAKHGASYYSGQGHGKKVGKKEPYARKCRLTEMYFKAVKSMNMSIVNINITNNGKLINWKMFDLNNYRQKKEPAVRISLQPTRKEEPIKEKTQENNMTEDEMIKILEEEFADYNPSAYTPIEQTSVISALPAQEYEDSELLEGEKDEVLELLLSLV